MEEVTGKTEEWPYPFTSEQMEAWKKEYTKVYAKQIGDEFYVYRPLTTNDFRKVRTDEYNYSKKLESDPDHDNEEKYAMSQDFTMEAVVKTCVLYPSDYAANFLTYGAGVLEQLNALIFVASGYTDTEIEPIKF